MVIKDFSEKYYLYENMSIWEVKTLDEFFKAHESMFEIFEDVYGFPFCSRKKQGYFKDSDIRVVSKLLNRFSDIYFFIFSLNDKHHKDLIRLQKNNTINFGMDIEKLEPDSIYVLEMDKTKDLRMYDL